MRNKRTKEMVYESLLDLTRKTGEPNRYFSSNKVFYHGEGVGSLRGIWAPDISPLSDHHPSMTDTKICLEDLTSDGKAVCVICDKSSGIAKGRGTYDLRFYRAVEQTSQTTQPNQSPQP